MAIAVPAVRPAPATPPSAGLARTSVRSAVELAHVDLVHLAPLFEVSLGEGGEARSLARSTANRTPHAGSYSVGPLFRLLGSASSPSSHTGGGGGASNFELTKPQSATTGR